MPTAVGQTKDGQSSYRLGREKAALSITANKIDNASSKRSREAPRQWYRVDCEKRVLSIITRIDNASSNRSRKVPRQWCRVGCEKRVLSILLSESTMPTAVGQTKDGRSSYRLGRDKTALSILLSESSDYRGSVAKRCGSANICGSYEKEIPRRYALSE